MFQSQVAHLSSCTTACRQAVLVCMRRARRKSAAAVADGPVMADARAQSESLLPDVNNSGLWR